MNQLLNHDKTIAQRTLVHNYHSLHPQRNIIFQDDEDPFQQQQYAITPLSHSNTIPSLQDGLHNNTSLTDDIHKRNVVHLVAKNGQVEVPLEYVEMISQMKLDKKNECDVRVDGVNHKRVLEDVLDGVGVLVLC